MPNPGDPIIIEDLLNINIKSLKARGLLKKEQCRQGELTWKNSWSNELSNSISIEVSTITGNAYVELSYYIDRKSYCYRIPLMMVKSNLGPDKGILYFFASVSTKKRSSKVCLVDTVFVPLVEIEGYYRKEVRPKALRSFDKNAEKLRKLEKAIQKMGTYQTYDGQPTKRFLDGIDAIGELDRLKPQPTPYLKNGNG